jgi:sterol desaturase/sphingolipid hydroxylase (fatty acid hydroxylase superfamily)
MLMDESSFGTRSAKGEWTPSRRFDFGPLFAWPTRPDRILRWVISFPGYLLPWNALYFVTALVAWWVATPSLATMRSFEAGWVLAILLRNLAIVIAWFGLFHLRLYIRRAQETRFKYNSRWPRESDRFLLGSQNRENVLLTLASGVPMATAYEVVSYWLAANGRIGVLRWAQHPVSIVVMFLLTPIYREFHFYAVHRLIHIPAIYQRVHALHHRNTNPGPWSGLSMHPIEHLLYYSAMVIHWVIPSHPMHLLFTQVHLTMAPAPGHSGFEKLELGDARAVDTNGLAHYLHHKYFEVNYSDGAVPLDRWFGSFHDGSPECHERMKQRLGSRKVPTTT